MSSVNWTPPRARELSPVLVRFLIAGLASSILYGLVLLGLTVLPEVLSGSASVGPPPSGEELSTVDPDPLIEAAMELGKWLTWLVTPVIPAAIVYTRLPDETVDIYHKFGKTFAMFAVINLTLSAEFLMWNYHFTPNPPSLDAVSLVLYFSIASAGLPGPYLGAIIGARWCNR